MKRFLLAVVIGACLAAGVWKYRQPPVPEAGEPAAAKPAKAEWLGKLYSQNPRDVEAATREVGELGAQALPAILEALHDPQAEAETLKAALKACSILGRTAAPIVGDVAEVLPEPGLTAEAAVALSYMGPQAFPPLRKALSNDDPIVRRESLRSIGKLVERAPLETSVILPLLANGMKDRDEGVRTVAATYIGIIHQGAETAVPALIGGLADSNAEVRLASATALASFEPALAAPAMPALRQASRDSNADVAREAGRAMLKLQSK
jgi:HEAT repeat protein